MRRQAFLLVLVLLSSFALAVTATPLASADPACTPGGVYVVFARGSGQRLGEVEEKAFKTHLSYAFGIRGITNLAWAELGNLDGDQGDGQDPDTPSIEYPATRVDDWHAVSWIYGASVEIGLHELVKHLNERVKRPGCDRETIVLGGYSQGADVIGWALEGNGADPNWSFSPQVRRQIGFVALYGDPRSNRLSSPCPVFAQGNARCGYGDSAGILYGRYPYAPDSMAYRIGSWCDQDDGICNRAASMPGNHGSVYRNWWIWQSAATIADTAKYKVDELNVAPASIVIRAGSNVYGKVGLTDPWMLLSSDAIDVQASGRRIAYLNYRGELWVKDGIYGAWQNEYGPVTQYALSGSLLIIRLGTNIFGKVGLSDPWVQLNPSPVADVHVAGNRIVWTDTGGNLFAKDGLYGGWIQEYGPVSQYAISSSVLVMRLGGNLFGKNGLTDNWVQLNPSPVSDVRVAGNRISWMDTGGTLFAKDGLYGGWIQINGPVSQFEISEGLVIDRRGTDLDGKSGSLTSGWVWAFNATPAASFTVTGSRIAYRDTNGSLWAKDGLYGSWANMFGPTTQYILP